MKSGSRLEKLLAGDISWSPGARAAKGADVRSWKEGNLLKGNVDSINVTDNRRPSCACLPSR